MFAAVAALVGVASLVVGMVSLPGGPSPTPERFHGTATLVTSDGARLTTRDRREITTVLERFARFALARGDLARAWSLVGPSMRQATTREEWLAGNVPFVRYDARPIRRDAWRPNEVRRNGANVDVLVQPAAVSSDGPATLTFDLRRSGSAWRVDSVYTAVTYSAAGEKPRVFSERDIIPFGPEEPGRERGRLPVAWLALPFALLLAGAVVPVVWLVRHVGRRRRNTTELPPLPTRRT